MTEYEQGSSPTFYATFVDNASAAVTVTSGTISIRHRWGGSITDVDDEVMVQLVESTYYYNWNIPAKADKTIYDVRYIGTYSDGTVVLGDETFQVVPRKFFDKKGGGLVQRIVTKGTWSTKEKNELIERIEDLLKRNNSSELLSIKEEIEKIPKEKFDLGKIEQIFKNLSNQVNVEFEFQKSEIAKYKELIEKLDKKEMKFNDEKIVKKLSELSKSIVSIDTDLKNERITRVISELEDLHKEIKEFEEVFVKTIPLKAAERIKDGNKRHDSN